MAGGRAPSETKQAGSQATTSRRSKLVSSYQTISLGQQGFTISLILKCSKLLDLNARGPGFKLILSYQPPRMVILMFYLSSFIINEKQ